MGPPFGRGPSSPWAASESLPRLAGAQGDLGLGHVASPGVLYKVSPNGKRAARVVPGPGGRCRTALVGRVAVDWIPGAFAGGDGRLLGSVGRRHRAIRGSDRSGVIPAGCLYAVASATSIVLFLASVSTFVHDIRRPLPGRLVRRARLHAARGAASLQ